MRDRPVLKLARAVCLPTGFGYTEAVSTRPKPLTRTGKFHVEYRSLGARPRTFLQYAAAPDAVSELLAAADQLQNVPREWLESPQDMCHGLRRVAGRIRKAVDRIEAIEPRKAVVAIGRVRSRVSPRISRPPAEQLAMF